MTDAKALPPADSRQRLLRASGGLIALGLVVEGISLIWAHPTAFVLFLFLGALLVSVGVLAYIWALLRGPGSRAEP